jgi:glycosyltransferase involved in cell wall biosynthesis
MQPSKTLVFIKGFLKSQIKRFIYYKSTTWRLTQHRYRKYVTWIGTPSKQPLVSVIIPTYNRFEYLHVAVSSIRRQAWKNIEIIVVNDASTDSRYRTLKDTPRIKFHTLESNSKSLFGYPSAGYVRQKGIEMAQGDYIAFLDDDDCWLPWKITEQVSFLNRSGLSASCTEGYYGGGVFDPKLAYPWYNRDTFFPELKSIYKGTIFLQNNSLPDIWFLDFFAVHNCVITSSVLVTREAIESTGKMNSLPNGAEDYDYWKRICSRYPFVYVPFPCVYYDSKHGAGRNY